MYGDLLSARPFICISSAPLNRPGASPASLLAYDSHAAPADCVFVHGAGGNSLLWSRTLQALSGGSRALAVNLPGHPSGPITCRSVSEYADSVHEFISSEGLAPVSVCGHSMGSAIALTLALDHPADVRALILVGAGAKLGVSPAILGGLADKPLRAIEELITPLSFHSVTLEAGREARTALSLSNLAVFLNDYAACDGFDVRGRLNEVGVPTLVACGDDDRVTPPRFGAFLGEKIRGAAVRTVAGAGHMVPLEKPAELGAMIQDFLSGLSR